jgi:hypothetical protein
MDSFLRTVAAAIAGTTLITASFILLSFRSPRSLTDTLTLFASLSALAFFGAGGILELVAVQHATDVLSRSAASLRAGSIAAGACPSMCGRRKTSERRSAGACLVVALHRQLDGLKRGLATCVAGVSLVALAAGVYYEAARLCGC